MMKIIQPARKIMLPTRLDMLLSLTLDTMKKTEHTRKSIQPQS